MSKKDTFFLIVLSVAVCGSIAITYYQTIVEMRFDTVGIESSDASDAE